MYLVARKFNSNYMKIEKKWDLNEAPSKERWMEGGSLTSSCSIKEVMSLNTSHSSVCWRHGVLKPVPHLFTSDLGTQGSSLSVFSKETGIFKALRVAHGATKMMPWLNLCWSWAILKGGCGPSTEPGDWLGRKTQPELGASGDANHAQGFAHAFLDLSSLCVQELGHEE